MKNITLILSLFIFITACKDNSERQQVSADELMQEIAFAPFGDAISETDALNKEEMAALFERLQPGDTIDVKFKSTVKEVCQNKGCWMKVDLGNKETMVKFKDYGFFVPKNIAGEEVILEGKAFIEEMSVEEQRHYAEDANKSLEEIENIDQPKQTLSFEAKGVLLKQ